jgi:hypothetical protein
MNCEDLRTRLPEYWSHELDEPARRECTAHLDGCDPCRQEAESLAAIWESLGLIPAEAPGREMRARFYESLEAYRLGMEAAEQSRRRPFREFFERVWPKRPVPQFAVSLATLALGLGIGYSLHKGGEPEANTGQLARLHGEVDSMRQLVALSLLQQSSPSERMKGVNWSYRVPQSDTEVLAALLYTVNHDENVNVRLAAVDALHYFSDSPVARKGLLQAIPKQTSPLVQIALIDLTVDVHDRQSAPVLEALARDPATNNQVKERVQWALERLK